jgi:hypothetical protein
VFGFAVAVRVVIPDVPPMLRVLPAAFVKVPAPERAVLTTVVPVFEAVPVTDKVS